MHINFLMVLLAALVPMVMGFIYYNPKVLGNAWMKAAGVTEDKMKGGNMAVVFIMSFVFSFLLSFELQWSVIHEFHVYSMFGHTKDVFDANPTSEIGLMVKGMMEKYGTEFRTFGHGALHGTIAALLLILPVLATNAMFERKSAKYIEDTGLLLLH